MKDMSDQMEFERAAEYRDLIEAVSTLRTKQRVIRQDMQDRDIFGYYVDKGWMCVQVFFVRQGKLIQRDVNMFPYYNNAEEDFLTYIGQFYLDTVISSLRRFSFQVTLIKSLSKLWLEMKSRFLNRKEARKSSWLI